MRPPKKATYEEISMQLFGLRPAPSQVWGSIRLVPLLRDVPLGDLRLAVRPHDDARMSVVGLKGDPDAPSLGYFAYIPYGLVMSWTEDGTPVVSTDTALEASPDKARAASAAKKLDVRGSGFLHRMVRRESDTSFRMLPLHFALEGFLAMHFAGPEVAWDVWSQEALRFGLSPRVMEVLPGTAIPDLGDALRIFEIHQDQCGVLLYVGDRFASAFVAPHPADYRAMHDTLLRDFYWEHMYIDGWLYRHLPQFKVELRSEGVDTIDDLARALEEARHEWGRFEASMAGGLIGRTVRAQRYRHAGPYSLYRFLTGLDENAENHLGEAMIHRDGTLAYLKTFKLDRGQCRHAYWLDTLANNDWNLDDTAEAKNLTLAELLRQLMAAGLGWMLSKKILHQRRR